MQKLFKYRKYLFKYAKIVQICKNCSNVQKLFKYRKNCSNIQKLFKYVKIVQICKNCSNMPKQSFPNFYILYLQIFQYLRTATFGIVTQRIMLVFLPTFRKKWYILSSNVTTKSIYPFLSVPYTNLFITVCGMEIFSRKVGKKLPLSLTYLHRQAQFFSTKWRIIILK
jgi:hypothetical protein